jgi:hypothetical protein
MDKGHCFGRTLYWVRTGLPRTCKCRNLDIDSAFEIDSDVISSETLQVGKMLPINEKLRGNRAGK